MLIELYQISPLTNCSSSMACCRLNSVAKSPFLSGWQVFAEPFVSSAHAQTVDWQKVDDTLGRKPAVSGDVHRYGFPITQSKLADALGLSVVHVNRVLQAFRAQGILDLKRQIVTLGDFEKIVQLGGFDSLEDNISAE